METTDGRGMGGTPTRPAGGGGGNVVWVEEDCEGSGCDGRMAWRRRRRRGENKWFRTTYGRRRDIQREIDREKRERSC